MGQHANANVKCLFAFQLQNSANIHIQTRAQHTEHTKSLPCWTKCNSQPSRPSVPVILLLYYGLCTDMPSKGLKWCKLHAQQTFLLTKCRSMSSATWGSCSMGLLFPHRAWIDICDVFIMLSSVSRFNFHCTVHNVHSSHFSQMLVLSSNIRQQGTLQWTSLIWCTPRPRAL